MAAALEPLKALVSFDTVGVTVLQAERTVYAETSAQQAMSSVLGLIMATAGCPWTDRLRPMARFHLPFASEAETLYRSISMFLLAREIDAPPMAPPFAALEELYENLHVVNRDMSRRLGAATQHGSRPQCDGASRFVHDAAARGARALARRIQAAVRRVGNEVKSAI